MILFKPEHVAPILAGTKTQTRRTWNKCRVKVGGRHLCYTRPAWLKVDPGQPFARVEITGARRENLGDISQADARREGYPNRLEYLHAFARINGLAEPSHNLVVWVVDFKLVDLHEGDCVSRGTGSAVGCDCGVIR